MVLFLKHPTFPQRLHPYRSVAGAEDIYDPGDFCLTVLLPGNTSFVVALNGTREMKLACHSVAGGGMGAKEFCVTMFLLCPVLSVF